jgi:protoporphyrinogen oxidase
MFETTLKKADPVYDDDYALHVAAIRQELDTRYPNLHLVGRNGMHKYNNQDHAMMTAMLCVENILADAKLYDSGRSMLTRSITNKATKFQKSLTAAHCVSSRHGP